MACTLGSCASVSYLKELQKKMPEIKELKKVIFDDSIQNCEICMIFKIKTLPFKTTRQRATKSMQIIHADVMGMIRQATYPKGYKYISVFIDDLSWLAMAYAMKTEDETVFELNSEAAEKTESEGATVKRGRDRPPKVKESA